MFALPSGWALKLGQPTKRSSLLTDEVVEDVGHAQWVFTIPKVLRVYFLHHRELLGKLSQAAAETVKELLAAAAGDGRNSPWLQ